MKWLRIFKWLGGLMAGLLLLAAVALAVLGWNWLRGPINRLSMERTGRELLINGDLQVSLDWPAIKISAGQLGFGNPPWASRLYMLTADAVDVALDLPALAHGTLLLDVVALRGGDLFLEVGPDGEQNWVLDPKRKKATAAPDIGRLVIDNSRVTYDDPARKTRLAAALTNRSDNAGSGLSLRVDGRYQGLPLSFSGRGDPLLALRAQDQPYPFRIEGSIGPTKALAEGTVTGIRPLQAIDVQFAVQGETLAELFPLLGIALPETNPYRTSGRIVHRPGSWRYQDFSARIGNSDGAGSIEVDTRGPRPFMQGELHFGRLDFSDLGPLIGHRQAQAAPRRTAATGQSGERHGVLPDVPFRTERWNSVDADIKLSAGTIIRNPKLPIERLATHLRMRDRVLTLDPLDFSVAGGTLGGRIELDGRHDPIRARVDLAAKGVVFERLFPGVDLKRASFGKVTGKITLQAHGNSVARMLGTASGQVGLVVNGGEVSRLAMEMADLHVLETIALKIAGDKPIRIRCGVADLAAKDGIMRFDQLVFDTEITNIQGGGSIDFGAEQLDLTLTPESKKPSLIALRSPIYVRGSFAHPDVAVDKKRIVLRSLGAVALGAANPVLALAPLIETGPGQDSDCGRLLQEMRRKAS